MLMLTVKIGTGVTIYGNSGIVSATSFYGDGFNLQNVNGAIGIQSGGVVVGTGFTTN